MRSLCALLSTLAALMFIPAAQAQASSADQMERSISLSSPLPQISVPDPTRALQAELKRVGCFDGAADGRWSEQTKAALADFARHAKLDVSTDAATQAAVESVQSRRDRVCPLACGAGRIERNGVCVAKPMPEAKPAKPQAAPDVRRAARERSQDEGSGSGMCWRHDGRGTSLVPCSEAPTGRRAY